MWAPRRTQARPLPTAPPDTLLTHSSILENTGALEQRHVEVMKRVGGGWVGGLAEPEDGAAEAAERRSSMGVRRVGGRCSRGGGDVAVLTVNSTAVPAYDAFCSAPVRCGKSACPGAGS